MADTIETRNDKFLKLIELPITGEDSKELCELFEWTDEELDELQSLTHRETCNKARHVVQMVSLNTILENFISIGSEDYYSRSCYLMFVLHPIAMTPEFC